MPVSDGGSLLVLFFLLIGRQRTWFFALFRMHFNTNPNRITSTTSRDDSFTSTSNTTNIRRIRHIQTFRCMIVDQGSRTNFSSPRHFFFMFVRRIRRRINVTRFGDVHQLFSFILVRSVTMNSIFVPFRIVSVFSTLSMRDRTFRTMYSFQQSQDSISATSLLRVNRLHSFRTIRPSFPTRTPNTRNQQFPIVFSRTSIIFNQISTRYFRTLRVRFLSIIQQQFTGSLRLVVLMRTIQIITVATIDQTTQQFSMDSVPQFQPRHTRRHDQIRNPYPFFCVVQFVSSATLEEPGTLRYGCRILGVRLIPSWVRGDPYGA